ncbi:hypothetical protein [Naasia lichenicola]|uniref:Uncharacterized protein n=1 Tax=Naasia lichenicola TaxID=2565933 RepID=A0A4S4FSQ6_9MICO|nr:hypothetical protein [Naasia lichenicola]THG33444.1 hypothetical protein E6C64_03650 [Naasia lichenicola]
MRDRSHVGTVRGWPGHTGLGFGEWNLQAGDDGKPGVRRFTDFAGRTTVDPAEPYPGILKIKVLTYGKEGGEVFSRLGAKLLDGRKFICKTSVNGTDLPFRMIEKPVKAVATFAPDRVSALVEALRNGDQATNEAGPRVFEEWLRSNKY